MLDSLLRFSHLILRLMLTSEQKQYLRKKLCVKIKMSV